jgi:hypothetical protein
LKTGTTVDVKEEFQKIFSVHDELNRLLGQFHSINYINDLLGYEIFPSLLTLFSMSQNDAIENKSLEMMTRFYNQREETARLISKTLFIFDKRNIVVF